MVVNVGEKSRGYCNFFMIIFDVKDYFLVMLIIICIIIISIEILWNESIWFCFIEFECMNKWLKKVICKYNNLVDG